MSTQCGGLALTVGCGVLGALSETHLPLCIAGQVSKDGFEEVSGKEVICELCPGD